VVTRAAERAAELKAYGDEIDRMVGEFLAMRRADRARGPDQTIAPVAWFDDRPTTSEPLTEPTDWFW
jgi:hypothetical protein